MNFASKVPKKEWKSEGRKVLGEMEIHRKALLQLPSPFVSVKSIASLSNDASLSFLLLSLLIRPSLHSYVIF